MKIKKIRKEQQTKQVFAIHKKMKNIRLVQCARRFKWRRSVASILFSCVLRYAINKAELNRNSFLHNEKQCLAFEDDLAEKKNDISNFKTIA